MLKGLSTNHGVSGEEGCPGYQRYHFYPLLGGKSKKGLRPWYAMGSLSCFSVLPDPTDNIFLECALDGGANSIISGDKHLLDIEVYKGIEIVRAREFLLKEEFLVKERDK